MRPRIESRLGFRVAGKLVRREVELGQHVKAGQVLARLDPQDYRLAADAAQAQLGAAVTNRDLAAADFKRFKELREQNFISGAELERREAALQGRAGAGRPGAGAAGGAAQPGQLYDAGRPMSPAW